MSQIEVTISAVDDQWVSVMPSNEIEDCPKCQAGEGCGGRPWFRGFFRQRHAIRLAQTTPPLNIGDHALLELPSTALNRASFLTYGLPLVLFILSIAATQSLVSEGLQVLIATTLLGLSGFVGYAINHHRLRQQLFLKPLTPQKHPTIHHP
ncbi:SoxR reducing system RseC family protein [Suttonella sp. R2A3]|uniref:SoxR reducing system RseC family protein n=1 Tax=Suttonella sp. R2A3 TaxID=2908648 RepID=UPI001F463446|nr:SoxR reducing system RseC family protein [Suttonella sp. R2A3]UJF24760.1 SoxR reducing system RseC family protein [Suttonella sp. R2A3]